MKITILGCGGSLGVPAAGGFWGACDPLEPRNERSRASLLVQQGKTNLVVDASYDIRTQLNRVGLKHLDGVLLSHAHSDHVNGLDDLRIFSLVHEKLLDMYGDRETLDEIERRWPHLFFNGKEGIYHASMQKKPVCYYDRLQIGDITVSTFEQDHTTCKSMGFRFGDFAYSVDVADLDEKALDALKGVETWVVDCSAYHRETIGTHANLKRVMAWCDLLKPKMTYLTVMTAHMDYKVMCEELPPHIRPAYDGLEVNL